MHILIFVDQHIDSLGGVQASIRLQKKYLERAGHTVTVCGPASARAKVTDKSIVLPSHTLTPGGEFQFFVPTKALLTKLECLLADRPSVDIVHIQADFWGAILGLAYAYKHRLPTVMTFHLNIGVGPKKALGQPAASLAIWLCSLGLRQMFPQKSIKLTTHPWKYIAQVGGMADVRLAPTEHFAQTLRSNGVKGAAVMSNGIDDDLLDEIEGRLPNDNIQFIWTGRFSAEKRPLEFLQAVQLANIPVQVHMYGGGPMTKRVTGYLKTNNIKNVTLHDRLPYADILQQVANSHVYIQTSVGYETQGMGVFEAASLGTPVVLCDPAIAADFPKSAYWQVVDSSTEALARAMVRAYRDIKSGRRGRVVLGNAYNYRQSAVTERAVDVYLALLQRTKRR